MKMVGFHTAKMFWCVWPWNHATTSSPYGPHRAARVEGTVIKRCHKDSVGCGRGNDGRKKSPAEAGLGGWVGQ